MFAEMNLPSGRPVLAKKCVNSINFVERVAFLGYSSFLILLFVFAGTLNWRP